MTTSKRRFCFLQGPHGSFFPELATALRAAGCDALRIGFNHSDAVEWGDAGRYLPFRDPIDAWPEGCRAMFEAEGVTDLVLYGDARAYHEIALQTAEAMGIRTHFFEEGYLRPYWITYEREGVNGRSPLMTIDIEAMPDIPDAKVEGDELPPARWGELTAHVAHSLRYHIRNHFLNGAYPNFHRHLPNRPIDDWRNVAARVFKQPLIRANRVRRERAVLTDPRPYHLVLLQLGWDASMRRYSPFSSVVEVIDTCVRAFAVGAPKDAFLVFKTHPLEDGREGLERHAQAIAARHGLSPDRVAFIEGGKLAALIAAARSVVTVNSTAAQQALWRTKPVLALGQAVFAKTGLVSSQPLGAFFADPDTPDPEMYRRYRRFLLATSQIRGGFYTHAGRALALRPSVTALLADKGPYQRMPPRLRMTSRKLESWARMSCDPAA